MTDLEISTARGDAEMAEFATVDAEAFASNVEETEKWLRAAGDRAHVRLAKRDGRIVGGYGLMGASEYYGGGEVPAQCVFTVAVDPHHRRTGIAGMLLQDLVGQARERGGAVAPLTASTTRLYRRWGWEICGRHIEQRVRTDALARLRGDGELVREPELEEMRALRRCYLRQWDGPVDTPPEWLDMTNVMDGERARHAPCVGWREQGQLTGHLRYEASERPDHWMQVRVEEFIATTRDAITGLLGFLGGFDAQSSEIVFAHSTMPLVSPLLYLLPDADKVTTVEGRICWMQRIVDLPRAVAARGWRGMDATIHLDVEGPADTDGGRWVLEVTGGSAQLTAGGEGTVRCGIGAMAAWYSGSVSAVDAARLGLMQGPAEALEAMEAALGPCRPWMPDFF